MLTNSIGNSAVNYDGKVISNRNPNFTNTHGMDVKVINIYGNTKNSQYDSELFMKYTCDIY